MSRFSLTAVAFLFCLQFGCASTQLPAWASGDWKKEDKRYVQILSDVKPYFGEDGFIDVPLVRAKLKSALQKYESNQGDPQDLMRALAWMQVALSDGNVFATEEMATLKRRFAAYLRYWIQSINSYSFVRTYAIVYYYLTSPETFVQNRLLEKLYAYNQNDAELELCYITWCAFNHEVAPNKLTLQKLLEKQEKMEFRQNARKRALAMCYSFLAGYEKKSPEFLEKSISLMNVWVSLLPKDHFENTKEFRTQLATSEKEKKKIIDRWRSGN
jgi:hypothetical protein